MTGKHSSRRQQRRHLNMTTNTSHSKSNAINSMRSILNRQLILNFSFLLILITSFSAHSTATPDKGLSLPTLELAMGTFAILIAQDAKGFGSYTVCCVAPVAGFWEASPYAEFNWRKFFIVTGLFGTYGIWNISMQDDDQSTVALSNFLLFNAFLLFEHTNSRHAPNLESISPSSIQFAPTKNGGTFVYQYRF